MRGKVSSLIKKKSGSQPVHVCSDIYMKTKIKSYGNNINTNFQGKKIPPKNILYKCLSLTMLDSVIRANKM